MTQVRRISAVALGMLLSLASVATVLANSTGGPFPK